MHLDESRHQYVIVPQGIEDQPCLLLERTGVDEIRVNQIVLTRRGGRIELLGGDNAGK